MGARAVSGLMLTYPVHQAADILSCHGNLVPGGKDQASHLELARLIARRFNEHYAAGGPEYFQPPDLLLSSAPLLLGLDGRKMGKSLGNSIPLALSADETAARIKKAKTDSIAHVTYDPVGRPEVSNLLLLAGLCRREDPIVLAESVGAGGGSKLKQLVTEAVNERFRVIRARRKELEGDLAYVREKLFDGNRRAEETAAKTLSEVRERMQMAY